MGSIDFLGSSGAWYVGRGMMASNSIEIISVTEDAQYERFLYLRIFHTNKDFSGSAIYGSYRHRRGYLESAIPPRASARKFCSIRGTMLV